MPTKATIKSTKNVIPPKAAAKPAAKAGKTPAKDLASLKPAAEGKTSAKLEKLVAEPKAIKLSIAIDAPKAAIEKLIISLKLRGAKMDIDLHSAACASLNHAGLHNDPTLLNRLLLALPKASRRNAMVVWAMKHGNVVMNDDAKSKETMPLAYSKGKAFNIVAAQAEPFWAMKNVREGTEAWLYMDYIGNVMKILARHAGDLKDPEHAKAKAALDALTGLNEALAVPADPAAPALH